MTTLKTEDRSSVESFSTLLIAPCGMNCALCGAHLRERKPCSGCLSAAPDKAHHCETCRLRTCPEMPALQQKYCFACSRFPCARLRQLDKRYRSKYGMSMIANLESMRELGLDGFVEKERTRWRCASCGHGLCVHKANCIYCGANWRPAHIAVVK